jgi:leader peptidase (prepilin peptidase) / N-methyltransferase
MDLVAGVVIGAVMAPLVFWVAGLLLTGPGGIGRTPVAVAGLLTVCAAAGAAVATLAAPVADRLVVQMIGGADGAGAVTVVTGVLTLLAYAVFTGGVLVAAVVDVVERRIPNRVTYPLLVTGVLGLPWLAHPVSGWALAAPLLGAVVSGLIGLLNAVLADQGLGDVKLAAVIGAWMAHLGLAPWVAGVLIGQLLMIAAVGGNQLRRRRAGLSPDYTPLGPSLAGGAVLAVAVAGLSF